MKLVARIALAVGVALTLSGALYGALAPTFRSTMTGLVIELLGIAVLIPALHAVIDQ